MMLVDYGIALVQRLRLAKAAWARALTAATASPDRGHHPRLIFLPNFCDVRVLLVVVVLAELLAFILILVAPLPEQNERWTPLQTTSLLVQWIALTSAAMLCASRSLLARLGNSWAAVISYLLLLALTVLISEAAYWVMVKINYWPPASGGWHRDFVLRNLVISAVVSAITLWLLYLHHQLQLNIEAQSRAQLEALQARIRPHFLFNSMNTIASLTRSAPALAEEAVQDLADLFRVSLKDPQQRVTLAEEIETASRYLHIEKLRMGPRLSVVWAVEGLPHQALLPSLTLQPLLENAVYHGIEPLPAGGTISIRGHVDHTTLVITIDNPIPPHADHSERPGHRMALDNVRQRLAAHFDDRAQLETQVQPGTYQVTLRLPLETAAS